VAGMFPDWDAVLPHTPGNHPGVELLFTLFCVRHSTPADSCRAPHTDHLGPAAKRDRPQLDEPVPGVEPGAAAGRRLQIDRIVLRKLCQAVFEQPATHTPAALGRIDTQQVEVPVREPWMVANRLHLEPCGLPDPRAEDAQMGRHTAQPRQGRALVVVGCRPHGRASQLVAVQGDIDQPLTQMAGFELQLQQPLQPLQRPRATPQQGNRVWVVDETSCQQVGHLSGLIKPGLPQCEFSHSKRLTRAQRISKATGGPFLIGNGPPVRGSVCLHYSEMLGWVMSTGTTHLSNSSSLSSPDSSADSLRVRPFLWAFLAIAAALS
jgi:hypothetical protein